MSTPVKDFVNGCPFCGHANCKGCCDTCSDPNCYRTKGQCPDCDKIAVEDARDSATRSYEAAKLFREVLGKDSYELHPFDESLMKGEHR